MRRGVRAPFVVVVVRWRLATPRAGLRRGALKHVGAAPATPTKAPAAGERVGARGVAAEERQSAARPRAATRLGAEGRGAHRGPRVHAATATERMLQFAGAPAQTASRSRADSGIRSSRIARSSQATASARVRRRALGGLTGPPRRTRAAARGHGPARSCPPPPSHTAPPHRRPTAGRGRAQRSRAGAGGRCARRAARR